MERREFLKAATTGIVLAGAGQAKVVTGADWLNGALSLLSRYESGHVVVLDARAMTTYAQIEESFQRLSIGRYQPHVIRMKRALLNISVA